MAFDVQAARKAGYTDDEIADFLGNQSKFDVAGARKAGYTAPEIVGFLSQAANDAKPDQGLTPLDTEQVTSARPWQGAGAGRGSPNDPRRVDVEQPKKASGLIGAELGQLRDEAFMGVQQSGAAVSNINAFAQANRLANTEQLIRDLEARGRGDSAAASRLRAEAESLRERLPATVGTAAEANADTQRASQMTMRPAIKKVSEAKTFGDAWEAFKEAPYDVIAGVTAQSLPQVLPGLIAAAVTGPAAGAAAMGLNSGVVEFGSSLTDFAQDKGIDTRNAKAVQSFYADPANLSDALKYAGTRAGIIGTMDAASGGIAGKTLAPAMRSPIKRQAVNMPAQMAVQGAAGGGGEAAAQLATKGEIDQPGQVFLEVAGELGGAPAEVAAFTREAAGSPQDRAARALAADLESGQLPVAQVETLNPNLAIQRKTQEGLINIGAAQTVDDAIAAAANATAPTPQSKAVDNIAGLLGARLDDSTPGILPPNDSGAAGLGGSEPGVSLAPGVGSSGPDGRTLDAGSAGNQPDGGTAPLADRGAAPALSPDIADTASRIRELERAPESKPNQETRGEPASMWFGRRGDGYQTPEDASAALPSRQRVSPDLEWKVEQMPSGRYRLAGYDPQARQPAPNFAQNQAPGLINAAQPAIESVANDQNQPTREDTQAQAPAVEAPAPAGSDAPGAAVPAPAGPAQVEGGGVAQSEPTSENQPSLEDLNSGKAFVDSTKAKIAKWVASATNNGTRAMDRRWEREAVKRFIDDAIKPMLVGKQTGNRAAAKIAIGKAQTFDELAVAVEKFGPPALTNPPTQAQAGTPAEGAGESRPAPEPTAEQKIRQAFDAAPRTIGNWHKLTVEHNGKTQEFLANMKRVNTSGKRDSAIHLVNIRPGRLMAGEPLQDLAYYYKLDGKNNLVEEGIPSIATPEQLKAFGRPDPRLIPVSQRKQADGFENLLSLKSTKLILDDGRGRKLYDVQVTPAFRNRHFVNGRMPVVNGLELKHKADVTGVPSDNGWVLIDNREQLASRNVPKNQANLNTSAEPAQKPPESEQVEANDQTPKQYHDARLRKMSDDTGTPLAEVREFYDTEGGRAESDRLWSVMVDKRARDGATLTRQTLDKFYELNPTARLPETTFPNGYQRPDARKQEAIAKDAIRQDRREAKAARAASEEQTGPYGRDLTPIAQGGKPFKTLEEAKDFRKKNTNNMVVKKVGKNQYVQQDATPKQIAAWAKAGKRLGVPQTGGEGPQHAHGFLIGKGGLSKTLMSDAGFDRNKRFGNRTLFADDGMNAERATELLVEAGYLREGASHNDMFNLVRKSVQTPQYTSDGWEQLAQAEQSTRFEDHLAVEQEAATEEDPFGPVEAFTPAEIAVVPKNIREEYAALMEAAEAAGVDVDAILEEAARITENQTQEQFNEYVRQALTDAIANSRRQADRRESAVQGREDAERGGTEGSRQDAGRPGAQEEGLKSPITPQQAGDMRAGDVVVDGNGVEYMAVRARFDFLEVAPFVNGRPNVSADTTFYFHLNPATAGAYESRRNDPVYATGRNYYYEDRQGEGLTAPTPEDIIARQERASRAEELDEQDRLARETQEANTPERQDKNLIAAVKLLVEYTGDTGNIYALAGRSGIDARVKVMAALQGVPRVPQAQAGVTALQDEFYLRAGIDPDQTSRRQELQFQAFVARVMEGDTAPALTAPTPAQVLEQQRQREAEQQRKEQGGDKPLPAKQLTGDVPDMFDYQGGIFDQPAEPEPKQPAPEPEPERFAAGKALTKEQRKQVLATLTDVYKTKRAERELKGVGRDGNERYGYVHSPELFEKSDITGAMVRYYVTLPDGKIAHPTELFPDYTQSDIDSELERRATQAKNMRDTVRRQYAPEAQQFNSVVEAGRFWDEKSDESLRKHGQWRTILPSLERTTLSNGEKFIMVPDATMNDQAMVEAFADEGWTPWKASAAEPAKPAAEMSAAELLRAAADKMEAAEKPKAEPAKAPEKIDDIGEKIGGARKDTAVSTGTRKKAASEEDDRPTWAKRFRISQVAGGFDVSVNGRDVTGKWTLSDTRTLDRMGQPKRMGEYFDSKEAAEAALPLLALAQKHRAVPVNTADGQKYEIWRDINDRKRVKVVDRQFDTRDEAMRYMAQNATQILETNTTFGEADLPKPESTQRKGVERRTGDVKGEDFRDTFGFRGVEFGLWNNQEERQEVMNAAYDGLLDLAEVLKVPPKAIGLNGDLALAFGARGKGLSGARAHYETDRVVMNLTKMNGAGALAHEWFHALDHYLARQDGKTTAEWKINKDGTRSLEVHGGEADMASGGFRRVNSGVREELRNAYTSLVQSLFTKAEQYVEDTARADKFVAVARGELEKDLSDLRKDLSEQKDVRYYKRNNKPASAEQLAEFDAMAAELVDGRGLSTEWKVMPGKSRSAIQTRHTNETLEKLNELYKAVRGRSGFNTERRGVLDSLVGYMTRYEQRLKMLSEATALTTKTKRVPTSFAMDAKSLDQGRGGDYWTSPHEMVARAFQGYVEDAIAAKEGRSPFLNYAPENAGILTPWGAKRPFPAGEERKAMNAEFDKFIDVLQTKETDKGVAMFSRTPAWRSELRDQIAAIKMESSKPEGWRAYIGGLTTKGVKPDEIEWSGVTDWLKLQTGKVTKQQVLDYLDGNGVQVQEVVLGEEITELPSGWTVEQDRYGNWEVRNERGTPVGTPQRTKEAALSVMPRSATPTKYSQYTLPGGENYREVLLTLPDEHERRKAELLKFQAEMRAKYNAGLNWGQFATAEERAHARRLSDDPVIGYRSSHWDTPNVLAHIRLNDRVDSEGRRVLFVEEAQSDWGQEGKKKGFAPKNPANPTDDEVRDFFGLDKSVDAAEYRDEMVEALRKRDRAGTLPRAPFVTSTDKWLSLALKRIITMAAQEGYDRVAFINGEQSAERYDLSKQVKSIEYMRNPSDGTYKVMVLGLDGQGAIWSKARATLQEIEDHVGKEIAQKMERYEGRDLGIREVNYERSLSGDGLKVGGSGMVAFYDKILPNTLKDVLKKVGGGQMETVTLPRMPGGKTINRNGVDIKTLGDIEQPGFTITPEMRNKAANGLPMFRPGSEAAGMPLAKAQSIVADLTKKWKNGPPVAVVASPSDLPMNAPDDARGVYWKGKVWIVAGPHKDRADIARTLSHEAVAHYGLRNILDADEWRQYMRNIQLAIKSGNKALTAIRDQVRSAYVDGDGKLYLTEQQEADEIAAKVVEQAIGPDGEFRPGFGFVKSVYARIMQFLRDLGLDVKLTLAEVQGMLVLAQKNLEAGKRTVGQGDVVVVAGRGDQSPMDMRAYHGTPHKVDKFSTDKIGTGEGAQAYGWGLYFTDKKEIAEHYRDTLANRDSSGYANAHLNAKNIVERFNGDSEWAASIVVEQRDNLPKSDPNWTRLDRTLNLITSGDYAKPLEKQGNLYEVEIPEDSEMLLWDKPLSEQPEGVRKQLDDAADGLYLDAVAKWSGVSRAQLDALPSREKDAAMDKFEAIATSGSRFAGSPKYPPQTRNGMTGEDYYRDLTDYFGSQQMASEALASFGIKGIKYLDGVSRNKPLRDVKREFLAELPEDAEFDEVMDLLGTGTFSPKNEAVIKALAADDWLGFDYPAQALSAALSGQLSNFDASPALVNAVAETQDGSTYNYVVFSGDDVVIQNAMFMRAKDQAGDNVSMSRFGGAEQRMRQALADQEAYNENPSAWFKSKLQDVADRLQPMGVDAMMSGNGQPARFWSEAAGSMVQSSELKGEARTLARLYEKINQEFDDAETGTPPKFMPVELDPDIELMPRTDRQRVVDLLQKGLRGELPTNDGAFSRTAKDRMGAFAGDPSPEEALSVQSAIEGKTAIEAADFIAQTAPEKQMRVIASRVADQMRRLQDAGMTFALNVAHLGDQTHSQMAGKMRGMTWRAFGSSNVDVFVQGADVTGLVGTSYETVLHELLHAVTQSAIYAGQQAGNTALNKDVQDLQLVHDAIIRHFNQSIAGKTVGELDNYIERIVARGHNALREMDEVVSWGLTNKAMQDYLESIPYKNTTLWGEFVSAIRKFLGLPESAETVLSEVLRITDRLLDAPVAQLTTLEMPTQTNYSGGLLNGARTGKDQTDTPAFKAWFGDSVVTDTGKAGGVPLRVYHGTHRDFSAFDAQAPSSHIPLPGFYFTPDADIASMFAESGAKMAENKAGRPYEPIGATVMPVYLSLQNPLDFDASEGVMKGFVSEKIIKEIILEARRKGHDGVVIRGWRDGSGPVQYVVFNPEQIKSAIGNRGSYDPADPNIMFSRGTTAEQEQEEQPRRPNIALRAIGYQGMDDAGSPEFSPGRLLYNMIGAGAGPLLSKMSLKAASPELRQIMRKMKIDVAKAQETAAAVAKESMALTEDERQMVSDLIEKELQAGTVPPEHAIRLAATINTVMGKQTDELLRLGMLSPESAERWRGAYLPRFYESKLTATASDLWADAVRKAAGGGKPLKGIRGKHLRGRGMYETIPVTQLADYETMGWEVRDPDYQPGLTDDGMVQVWRDFTRLERDKMGEIRDAGFRFVMGYMQTQKDIALGRMFEALATNPEMSSKYAVGDLTVEVPTGTAPGTEVKTYGKLAGRYVSPETLSQLSMIEEAQSEALMMYRKAMGLWKEGKTVLNPVAHANNVISNITMAHFAGVSYGRVDKYLAAIRDFATKSDDVLEAKDAGLFLGTMNEAELFNTLPEELKALAQTQESTGTKIGRSAFNLLSFYLRKPMGWAYQAEDTFFRYLIYKDARGRGLSPDDAVDYAQKFIFTYDDLPKNARRIRDYGIPFFAYTYKAIPALLETALTHPERFAAPMAVIMAANAVAYAIAAGDDDDSWELKLKKYLTDPEYRKAVKAKEQLERELLPEWLKGKTALQTDRTIRLGMDELTKLPMFLDISRMIPGGDMFDMHNNAGGMPWPEIFAPNHPLIATLSAMRLNKDLFYGKEIVNERTDTSEEAARKRMDWMWKQMTPAIAYGNYHWERWMNALAQATGGEVQWAPEWATDKAIATGIGRDGLPVQPKLAAMQTFGIKARPYDLDKAEEIQRAMTNKDVREIEAEMRSLRRLMDLGAVSDRTYDRKREAADEKKERLRDGLTVDGKPR